MPFEAGRRLAAGLPQARFMTLEGKAHPPWVDGRAIADIVHSFLAGEDPLAAASLPATGCRLDEDSRELVLDGRHEPTTRLEYGVMLTLIRASGRVVTRDEMGALKPAPDGWVVIARHFGAPEGDAVVVGDSWMDGLAAAKAGVPFVAYRAKPADLERWGIQPIAHFTDLATLPAWLAARAGRAAT